MSEEFDFSEMKTDITRKPAKGKKPSINWDARAREINSQSPIRLGHYTRKNEDGTWDKSSVVWDEELTDAEFDLKYGHHETVEEEDEDEDEIDLTPQEDEDGYDDEEDPE